MAQPNLTPQLSIALFTAATDGEFGLRIPVEPMHIDRALTMLHSARKEAADPTLDVIMVCTFREDGEIWLVKKTTELEPQNA